MIPSIHLIQISMIFHLVLGFLRFQTIEFKKIKITILNYLFLFISYQSHKLKHFFGLRCSLFITRSFSLSEICEYIDFLFSHFQQSLPLLQMINHISSVFCDRIHKISYSNVFLVSTLSIEVMVWVGFNTMLKEISIKQHITEYSQSKSWTVGVFYDQWNYSSGGITPQSEVYMMH